jgi:uncharacterized protein YjbI with pentapeptide repeats
MEISRILAGSGLLLVTALLAWFWWFVPRRRVPQYATKSDLDRLDAEDKFRQTIGQLFVGGAVILTFALTVYQAYQATYQWNEDSKARDEQSRSQRFTEALKELNVNNDQTSHVAALYAIHALAAASAYEIPTKAILQTHIRRLAISDKVKTAGISTDCVLPDSKSTGQPREEANAEVQAAMDLLGTPILKMSVQTPQIRDPHLALIKLEHLFLDDLDLDGRDFSGTADQNSYFTNSYFRRVNFRGAHLEYADFTGAHFADWENPGYPQLGKKLAKWLYSDEPDWRRYRCWVTDFRWSHLTNTNFEHTYLGGADFTNATIDASTNFKNADISRANFTKTNITKEQITSACGMEQPVLPDSLAGVAIAACKN